MNYPQITVSPRIKTYDNPYESYSTLLSLAIVGELIYEHIEELATEYYHNCLIQPTLCYFRFGFVPKDKKHWRWWWFGYPYVLAQEETSRSPSLEGPSKTKVLVSIIATKQVDPQRPGECSKGEDQASSPRKRLRALT